VVFLFPPSSTPDLVGGVFSARLQRAVGLPPDLVPALLNRRVPIDERTPDRESARTRPQTGGRLDVVFRSGRQTTQEEEDARHHHEEHSKPSSKLVPHDAHLVSWAEFINQLGLRNTATITYYNKKTDCVNYSDFHIFMV